MTRSVSPQNGKTSYSGQVFGSDWRKKYSASWADTPKIWLRVPAFLPTSYLVVIRLFSQHTLWCSTPPLAETPTRNSNPLLNFYLVDFRYAVIAFNGLAGEGQNRPAGRG